MHVFTHVCTLTAFQSNCKKGEKNFLRMNETYRERKRHKEKEVDEGKESTVK